MARHGGRRFRLALRGLGLLVGVGLLLRLELALALGRLRRRGGPAGCVVGGTLLAVRLVLDRLVALLARIFGARRARLLVQLLQLGGAAALALDVVDRRFLPLDVVGFGAATAAALAQAVFDRELLVAGGSLLQETLLDDRALFMSGEVSTVAAFQRQEFGRLHLVRRETVRGNSCASGPSVYNASAAPPPTGSA
jgi:hypothetical protein